MRHVVLMAITEITMEAYHLMSSCRNLLDNQVSFVDPSNTNANEHLIQGIYVRYL